MMIGRDRGNHVAQSYLCFNHRNKFRGPFPSYSTQSATKMLVSWGCLP